MIGGTTPILRLGRRRDWKGRGKGQHWLSSAMVSGLVSAQDPDMEIREGNGPRLRCRGTGWLGRRWRRRARGLSRLERYLRNLKCPRPEGAQGGKEVRISHAKQATFSLGSALCRGGMSGHPSSIELPLNRQVLRFIATDTIQWTGPSTLH